MEKRVKLQGKAGSIKLESLTPQIQSETELDSETSVPIETAAEIVPIHSQTVNLH